MSEIVNRVANSPLVTINLEDLYRKEERAVFDIKDFLFQELVLKELDFRTALKSLDWNKYKSKLVAVTCTADAIVPAWAFMLVSTYLSSNEVEHVIGDLMVLENFLFESSISKVDPIIYKDRPVVIKGCSKFPVPAYAYGRLLNLIQPYAKSIMYGEPCSTVPLYKAPK
ncbi:DUF2480 family protein [Belliella kenyensis]|uniref:DUF2480 family protein n=1 Tax=Belliella kenyensis TaxID=1472724 RepID=A0ABV8EI95_9BACT|nr:DUF2480 family protein [Belliella kenyensis]MCH7403054.1 DUF2480 family protein [Belliella kenyensis]MDN3602223.1 DUF2480 family protein [Belliella kenyensis]